MADNVTVGFISNRFHFSSQLRYVDHLPSFHHRWLHPYNPNQLYNRHHCQKSKFLLKLYRSNFFCQTSFNSINLAGVILSFCAMIILCIPLKDKLDHGYRTTLVLSTSSNSTKTTRSTEEYEPGVV